MRTLVEPRTTTLDCGLEFISERNQGQRSASVCWLVPGGVAHDPADHGDGYASMISEFLLRGAGSLDSRALSEAFDLLGARRSVIADTFFLRLSMSVAGEQFDEGLALLVDLVRAPHFSEGALEAVRSLALQELRGLEDDPSHLGQVRLDAIRLPEPFCRHGIGEEAHLRAAEVDGLRSHFQTLARPGGSIMAASGAVDHDAILERLATLLEGFQGDTPIPAATGEPIGGATALDRPTAQAHLAMGFTAPVASHDDAVPFQIAAGILGGGASGRLFTEVRERRGLAYSIGGRYEGGRSIGAFTISAGTTPERMDTTREEIDRVLEGFPESITDEEGGAGSYADPKRGLDAA